MSVRTDPAYQTSPFAATRWDVLSGMVRSVPNAVPQARRTWAVWASLLAHGLLLLALMFSVSWRSEPEAILQAELWGELPPMPEAPSPQPEPAPVDAPTPPATTPPVTSTPDPDPQALAVERVKPPKKEVKAVEKVEKPASPKAVTKQPKPADTQAKLQEKRTAELARLNQLSAQNGAVKLGTPQQGSASGLSAQWKGKLKSCVQPHLRYSDPTGANPKVEIDVQLLPSRTPVGTKIIKSSGNPAFDAAVERAILRCDPFPTDTQPLPSSLNIVYRLND